MELAATSWAGKYFDGVSTAERMVRAHVQPTGLRLQFPDGTVLEWPYSTLQLVYFPGPEQWVMFEHKTAEHGPSGQVHVAGREIVRAIETAAPGAVRRMRGGSEDWYALGGLAGVALLLILALLVGVALALPWFSAQLAVFVPLDVESQIGSAVARSMAPESSLCVAPAVSSTLSEVVARIDNAAPESPYRYTVRILRTPETNALAAPGGYLVVYQGLLELAESEDELAAVLAHEMAHVRFRHTTKQLFRQAGFFTAIALITGDATGGIAALAAYGGVLHFARGDELEADRAGLEWMAAAGYDPLAMRDIFTRLSKAAGEQPAGLKYLSTHPNLDERIRAIEKLRERLILSRGETKRAGVAGSWDSVRRGCQ